MCAIHMDKISLSPLLVEPDLCPMSCNISSFVLHDHVVETSAALVSTRFYNVTKIIAGATQHNTDF